MLRLFPVARASLGHSVDDASLILLCPQPQCWEHRCVAQPALLFSHFETRSHTVALPGLKLESVLPPDPFWQDSF